MSDHEHDRTATGGHQDTASEWTGEGRQPRAEDTPEQWLTDVPGDPEVAPHDGHVNTAEQWPADVPGDPAQRAAHGEQNTPEQWYDESSGTTRSGDA